MFSDDDDRGHDGASAPSGRETTRLVRPTATVSAIPIRTIERIRKAQDIRRVFRRGRLAGSQFANVHVLPNRQAKARAAIIASRKVGNACRRNRLRRRLREILRLECYSFERPVDVVVVAKPSAADAVFQELRADIGRLLAQAGASREHRGGADRHAARLAKRTDCTCSGP